jgi:hypothetical protein
LIRGDSLATRAQTVAAVEAPKTLEDAFSMGRDFDSSVKTDVPVPNESTEIELAQSTDFDEWWSRRI